MTLRDGSELGTSDQGNLNAHTHTRTSNPHVHVLTQAFQIITLLEFPALCTTASPARRGGVASDHPVLVNLTPRNDFLKNIFGVKT